MRARELTPKRSLIIFDIDDTLLHTTARIKVINKKTGEEKSLNNQQFNNYKLGSDEFFDFGEFRSAEKFRQESKPIVPMVNKLKRILDHANNAKVIMLTARADFDDKEKFLQTFLDLGIDMSRVHVHRAGNLPGDDIPAEKKAVWVRRYLDTGKYKHVRLYDDNKTNLLVFKELKTEYPQVDFRAIYVGPEGSTKTVQERKKKYRKKSKYRPGAYGPGPYGWYGYNAGYSGEAPTDGGGGGDGGVEESVDYSEETFIEIFSKFLPLTVEILRLKSLPKFKFEDYLEHSDQPTFGMYRTDENTLYVALIGRHPNDILRTIAHELAHYKQGQEHLLGNDSGRTGSPEENQANAVAGIIMRHFNKKYPEYLKAEPITNKY